MLYEIVSAFEVDRGRCISGGRWSEQITWRRRCPSPPTILFVFCFSPICDLVLLSLLLYGGFKNDFLFLCCLRLCICSLSMLYLLEFPMYKVSRYISPGCLWILYYYFLVLYFLVFLFCSCLESSSSIKLWHPVTYGYQGRSPPPLHIAMWYSVGLVPFSMLFYDNLSV